MHAEARSRFSALVKETIKSKNIKQEDLAKSIGVTQSTISLWVLGKIKGAPSQRALMAFADFADLTLDELNVRLGMASQKEFNFSQIKIAIGQADLKEVLAFQEIAVRRAKQLLEREGACMESIGKAIYQHMTVTGLSESEIAAELKKRGFKNVESRLPEILAGDSAYMDELRAIALFLYGPEGKSDQVRAMFGIKKPALRPEQATLNGANS